MVKLDAAPGGGLEFDRDFYLTWPGPHRPHQIRLEGGDASSDSYCYP
jgi:selenium-binding protein 1